MQQENKTPSYSGTTVLHRRECLPIKKKKKVKIPIGIFLGINTTNKKNPNELLYLMFNFNSIW